MLVKYYLYKGVGVGVGGGGGGLIQVINQPCLIFDSLTMKDNM